MGERPVVEPGPQEDVEEVLAHRAGALALGHGLVEEVEDVLRRGRPAPPGRRRCGGATWFHASSVVASDAGRPSRFTNTVVGNGRASADEEVAGAVGHDLVEQPAAQLAQRRLAAGDRRRREQRRQRLAVATVLGRVERQRAQRAGEGAVRDRHLRAREHLGRLERGADVLGVGEHPVAAVVRSRRRRAARGPGRSRRTGRRGSPGRCGSRSRAPAPGRRGRGRRTSAAVTGRP